MTDTTIPKFCKNTFPNNLLMQKACAWGHEQETKNKPIITGEDPNISVFDLLKTNDDDRDYYPPEYDQDLE